MPSLQKKLKDTRNALSTDHHLPQCCEKNLILLIDTHLEELGKVAQQIRARITELSKAFKRLEESTGCSTLDLEARISFEREIQQLTWVLGLLVEKVEGET